MNFWIVLWSSLCRSTFDVCEICWIAPIETLFLSCIRVLQLPPVLNLAVLREFTLMALKLVTKQRLWMLWYRVTFHRVVGTAFVQRADPFTVLNGPLDASWSPSPLIFMTWLKKLWFLWFWMESKMEIVFLTQRKTFNLNQRKPKCLLKGLVFKGKLRKSVLVMLSQSVLSWIGESDQFGSAKSGRQAYWQCRMTGLMYRKDVCTYKWNYEINWILKVMRS